MQGGLVRGKGAWGISGVAELSRVCCHMLRGDAGRHGRVHDRAGPCCRPCVQPLARPHCSRCVAHRCMWWRWAVRTMAWWRVWPTSRRSAVGGPCYIALAVRPQSVRCRVVERVVESQHHVGRFPGPPLQEKLPARTRGFPFASTAGARGAPPGRQRTAAGGAASGRLRVLWHLERAVEQGRAGTGRR